MTVEEYLSVSLPYGLKVKLINVDDENETLPPIFDLKELYLQSQGFVKLLKPILRPISDINTEIEHNGKKFNPYQELKKLFNRRLEFDGITFYNYIKGSVVNGGIDKYEPVNFICIDAWLKLIEWHFDILGLIDQNLAVNVNTLNENPYG